DGQYLEFSVLHVLDAGGNRVGQKIDLSGKKVRYRRRAAAVGNVQDFQICPSLEFLDRQMPDLAEPLRSIAELVRICLSIVDQLGQRVHRQVRTCIENRRVGWEEPDGAPARA